MLHYTAIQILTLDYGTASFGLEMVVYNHHNEKKHRYGIWLIRELGMFEGFFVFTHTATPLFRVAWAGNGSFSIFVTIWVIDLFNKNLSIKYKLLRNIPHTI